jgi:hypothetical protein
MFFPDMLYLTIRPREKLSVSVMFLFLVGIGQPQRHYDGEQSNTSCGK